MPIAIPYLNRKSPVSALFQPFPRRLSIKITEKYIKDANAVLIVVAAAALHSETLATITKAMDCVGSDKKKAYIVATQVDRCNTPGTE